MPQSVCLTTALPLSLAVVAERQVERDRAVAPASVSSPSHGDARRRRRSHARSSGTRCAGASGPRRRSSAWMFALSSSSSACIPPVPSRTRSERGVGRRARCSTLGSSPTSSVASQAVTWISEVVPGLRRRAGPPGPHRERAVVGPEPVRARLDRHRAEPICATRRRGELANGRRAGSSLLDGEADRRELRGDHRPRARGAVRRGRQRARDDRPDSVKAEIKVKMGAMSMTFTGTVEIVEQDAAAHRAVMRVKSREAGGQGHANATSRSRSRTAAARSTRTRRSPARRRRWARAWWSACSTR